MTSGLEPEEVVGFGAGRPASRGRLHRAGAWLAAHRLVAGALVGVLVVVGVALAVVTRPEPPPLPAVKVVAVDQVSDPVDVRQPYPWRPGADGRPDGPVRLRGQVGLTFTGTDGRVEVLGIEGPGVRAADQRARRLAAGERELSLPFDVPVDCDRTALPVPEDAYVIAVRVTRGGAERRGAVSAGPESAAWARTVDAACGSWLARRHLTVARADVTVDPRRTRARLALTFANDGAIPIAVAANVRIGDQLAVTTTPDAGVRVPPDGTARLVADVGIDACDPVADIRLEGDGTGVPIAVTTEVIDLYANAGGSARVAAGRLLLASGFGPTPIVMSADAARALSDGLKQACGGITGFAALVDPERSSYDPATRVLSVRLSVDGPAGAARDLQLVGSREDFGLKAFESLTVRTPRLKPDSTGQITTTLRYRAPRGQLCPKPNLFLPGFDIVARVPDRSADGELRTVRFTQFAVQWQDDQIWRALCR